MGWEWHTRSRHPYHVHECLEVLGDIDKTTVAVPLALHWLDLSICGAIVDPLLDAVHAVVQISNELALFGAAGLQWMATGLWQQRRML